MPKIDVVETGTPAPLDSAFLDKWVEYKGQRVTEIPAGENFDIRCKIRARNPGALTWETLVTCFSSDGTIAVYDTTYAYSDPYVTPSLETIKVDTPAPGFSAPKMPNTDITLNFRLWGNDTREQTVPPISNW